MPPALHQTIKQLEAASMKSDSRGTYHYFLSNLLQIITKSINNDSVQKLLRMTGLHPLNPLVSLCSCRSWSQTPKPQAQAILAAVDPLLQIARPNGLVTDPEIHTEAGALVDFGPPPKSACTVCNRRRDIMR